MYDMLTQGIAPFSATTPEAALAAVYARGENDEFVQPTLVMAAPIADGDAVIFINPRRPGTPDDSRR